MLDEKPAPTPRATLEIGLDQLIAAARTLPPEARAQLRKALDDASDEAAAWRDEPLNSETDPVLADLWNNEDDAVYDQI